MNQTLPRRHEWYEAAIDLRVLIYGFYNNDSIQFEENKLNQPIQLCNCVVRLTNVIDKRKKLNTSNKYK